MGIKEDRKILVEMMLELSEKEDEIRDLEIEVDRLEDDIEDVKERIMEFDSRQKSLNAQEKKE